MMRPRISRFERRILVSLLLTGLVPFLVWLVLGLKLLLDAPLELPREARERFGTALFFYKSFIDAKKSEFSARADSIAKDPILRDAVERGAIDDARIRLEGLVADYSSIRRIKLTSPEGEKLLEVAGPEERMTDEFRPRTWLVPLGLGFAPKLYIVFLEPSDWRKKRDELQTFQEKYEAAVIDGQQRLSSTLERFAFVTAIVLLIALVIGFTIARGVTKRINRMAAATEDVAQGRLEIEIPVDGNDEITELTVAFNKMVAEIDSARDRIVYLEKVSGWQDLARRLAHEIKNPLTPIQLAIQELHRRMPQDTRPEFRQLVEDSSEIVTDEIGALTRLVDEFSQFARLPEVAPESVDLAAFVEDFLSAYNRFEPDADVAVEMPDDAVTVTLDRILMRRVFANLAENAIEAAGKGKARLSIAATINPDRRGVELVFEDNGPGVSDDNAARIFEPYFTTKSDGTGLGLAIVKKIVLQHGGTIALNRGKAGGALFVIRLPAKVAKA